MGELVPLRREKSKTYLNPDGTFTEFACLAPLHYDDGAGAQAQINCTPNRVNNAAFDGWTVTANGWHLALGKPADKGTDGWVGFGGRRGTRWLKTRLVRVGYLHWPTRTWQDIGGAPTYARANLSQATGPRVIGDASHVLELVAGWVNIWTTPGGGALDITWRFSGNGIKEIVSINQVARAWIAANRPPITTPAETWVGFAFQIDWADVASIAGHAIADDHDATDGAELRDALDEFVAFLPACHVRVRGEKDSLPLQRRVWHDVDGNHYLFIGVRSDLLAALPAGTLDFDPTVTPRIAAQHDDCEAWYSTGFDAHAAYNYLGATATAEHTGLRIALAVPQYAIISAAKVTFKSASNNSSTTAKVRIFSEVADNPGDFGSDNYTTFMARTRSGEYVDWTLSAWTTNTTYDTPELATVFQARISAATWASGEALILLFDDNGSTTNAYRIGQSYDGSAGDAPLFTVTYTVGVPKHAMYYARMQR